MNDTDTPAKGHILRVIGAGRSVAFAVECHEPAGADCRTASGKCLVNEQATGDPGTFPFGQYHDGMRIVAVWSTADGCYTWHGYLEDGAA